MGTACKGYQVGPRQNSAFITRSAQVSCLSVCRLIHLPPKEQVIYYIYILYTIRIITISSFVLFEIHPFFKKLIFLTCHPVGPNERLKTHPRPRHGDFWPCTGGFPWSGFYGELFRKQQHLGLLDSGCFFFEGNNTKITYIIIYIYISPEIFLGTAGLTNIFSFFLMMDSTFSKGVDLQLVWHTQHGLEGGLMGEVYPGPKSCPFCLLKK